MKTFLIQTVDGQVVHDFSFHLIQAVRYNNWFYNEKLYDIKLSDSFHVRESENETIIPIGSLEFVMGYMEKHKDSSSDSIRPINIPNELMKRAYTNRHVEIKKKEEIIFEPGKELFLKSATKYKQFTEVVSDIKMVPEDTYMVSEVLDIKSEWRTFVHHGELVGMGHYGGDFTCFPSVESIKDMIKAYTDAPVSYTLDVGVGIDNEVFVIEVHPFVSCGLYGFHDYRILPNMCIEGYRYFIQQR